MSYEFLIVFSLLAVLLSAVSIFGYRRVLAFYSRLVKWQKQLDAKEAYIKTGNDLLKIKHKQLMEKQQDIAAMLLKLKTEVGMAYVDVAKGGYTIVERNREDQE